MIDTEILLMFTLEIWHCGKKFVAGMYWNLYFSPAPWKKQGLNFSSVPWKRGVYTMDPTQQTFNLQGADSF